MNFDGDQGRRNGELYLDALERQEEEEDEREDGHEVVRGSEAI